MHTQNKIAGPKDTSAKKRFLLFTSAGDNSALKLWLDGKRNFDIWVSYYGNTDFAYADQVEFFIVRKGGKFPNLFEAYQENKTLFQQYDFILVSDDDLRISGQQISKLFTIAERYNLDICQAAFDPRGKISHPHTMVRAFSYLRYTNFVEVTCPLFKTVVLENFLKVYNPILVCHGVDWWYCQRLDQNQKNIAIVDAITCLNPLDQAKGGVREINLLQSDQERHNNWQRIKEQYGVSELSNTGQIFSQKTRIFNADTWRNGCRFGMWYLGDAIITISKAIRKRLVRLISPS